MTAAAKQPPPNPEDAATGDGSERKAYEEHVADIFDDWDDEERAALVTLMFDDETEVNYDIE